jgi:multidrug efflux system membrane fusion protein
MIGLTLQRRLTHLCVASSLSVLVLSACSGKQKKPPSQAIPVTVATAKRMSVPYTVTANGLVTPMQTAVVSPQVDGIITRVAFKEGQDVTTGQILFQIDPQPYRAAYQQAVAMLVRDQATAKNAEAEVKRYDQLVEQDYVTKEQADQERATSASAVATVQGDSAAIATAKFNLDNTTIRAPISGRTGSLLIREGNLVHAASGTALVVINQITPILVRFAVPATQLPLIQQYGAHGGLTVMAIPGVDTSQTSGDSAGSGPPSSTPQQVDTSTAKAAPKIAGVKGTLSFIDNAVDTTTGTVILKATFPNTDKSLWTGEFLATTLRLFVEQNALVVPAQSVTTGQQGAYVYVIDSAQKVRQQSVTVERAAGNRVVIASGLKEGDRVVTDGQSRLTPGAKVSVRTAADTGAAGAASAAGTGQHKGHGHKAQ